MKEQYQEKGFHKKSLEMISKCDDIISEFSRKGFKLTVRQLYYQLVSRGFIPNNSRSYDNIVALMTNARLDGRIDWDAIEDRTRDVLYRSSWSNVKGMLNSAQTWYHEHMWHEQPCSLLAVVEKEALAGIFQHILRKWDIPLLPARGYTSATALRDLANERIIGTGQDVVILHFGDHDPSGIDMSRDLMERLELFSRGEPFDFRRLALNMDQIEEQNPPPFFAKISDSRHDGYVAQYGNECWELDALSPEYLSELVRTTVEPLIDWDQWNATERRIARRRKVLTDMRDNYDINDGTRHDPVEKE